MRSPARLSKRDNHIKVLRTWLTRTEVKNSIFTSIIAAITAALLISGINVLYDSFKEKHDVINAIQNILIGSNKEWIDSELGPFNFSSIQGNFVECVYILDTTAVTVFYDIGTNSCRGYFVTLLKKDILFPIKLPSAYSWITRGKPIGKISYYDIELIPHDTYGYVSNGTGQAFYGEEYYYASSGNYYTFLFASLDFGELQMPWWEFAELLELKWSEEPIDDEIGQTHGQVITDRKNIYPNTYGIVASNDILPLFIYNSGFDSFQLGDKNSINISD